MRVGLRQGIGLWREAGTKAALRGAGRLASGVVREARLRAKPGGLPSVDTESAVAALRGPVLAAMPSVARFQGETVETPDDLLAHRFDLLGSGPTGLGPEIDWLRDFKSGRRWPLRQASLVRPDYRDGSDIKVPWELSRCQHLPLLAASGHSGEVGAQIRSWIAANPVELGPNWASTMDVAIRAANWVAALALCPDDEPWFEGALGSLLQHGRFIRRHLEWSEARGNHYLSNVVGLLPVAALFSGSDEGRKWAEWAARELVAEMEHQVRPDGVAHEASTAYHRLVTELFLCGTQAADSLVPEAIPEWYRERLDLMLGFVRDYTRPDGLAPQIGDADDGRFLPLGDYGADPRDHGHLFKQAGRALEAATESSAYREGGFYILRDGDLYAIVHCGDIGRYGRGGHGHNDQLSFELATAEGPLVVDPGTFVYTPEPVERNRFRSTAYHATLRIGSGEQNELGTADLFSMEDRTRAEALHWDATSFKGRHHGFPGATHTRRIELVERGLRITDTVTSEITQELEWTFPLAPGAEPRVEIEAPGLEFAPEPGWYSPRYGVREPTKFLKARRLSRPGEDVTEISVRARG